ncbi:MAG: N-acetylmuramoyl-L-alanine amidase, partial [Endomicrobiaceae bacterium]|nr:N-acetylmuramoyl-L-alanine amidase [Endomicrobiaceae bacterium]
MKKLLLCLSLLMFLCSAGVFSDKKNDSEIKIDIQKANVIFDGINHNGINIYEIQKENFLSLNEIAVLFNARIEWQPVSGKVSMKLKNRSIDIFYNTKKITYGKKKKKLYTPSLNIHNEIYVPAEFLTYKEFTNISETIVTFDKKNRLFVINSQTNISAVRYYTKENSTEISIELNEKMTHTVKKAKNAIIVAFQRGKIANDTIYIDNGIIKNISYGTAGREAVFKINLQQRPKLVSTKKFKKPLKFVITIEHSAPVDMSKPCLVSLPETVVPDENIENTVLSEESNIAKISTEEESPEIPVINQAVITAESEVYEKPVSDGDDIEDLAKIKTPSVSDDQIIDDSYAIVDEKGTFKDIIPSEKEKSQTAKLIVLDAGHGGEDPGAIGPNGTKEKDINLAITLALKKLFDKDKNYKVILTRTNDIFIPLAERTNIANENKADLFISIHNNANFKKEISGFEIYFLSENASDSE